MSIINSIILTEKENILLEIELFACISEELKELFKEKHKEYFQLMKFTKEKENIMIETTFVPSIIQDILATDEYNIEGIARYTNTHLDVILEISTGLHSDLSATLFRKIIELHRTVRQDLYLQITQKIISKYSV
jgi:hypothetical protein